MIIADILMTILPPGAYIPQINIIKEQKQMGSFSIYVPGILLISNILRVFFWLAVGFPFNLLIQAFLMIAMQMYILYLCVPLCDHSGRKSSLVESFWKWEKFEDYVRFLLGMSAVMTVVTLFVQLFSFGFLGQTIGFASMCIEATLGMPQAWANYKSGSVQGLSIGMVMAWFFGDFGKTIYFISMSTPFQFVLCGVIQLTVDIIILGQIFVYSKKAKKYDPVNQ